MASLAPKTVPNKVNFIEDLGRLCYIGPIDYTDGEAGKEPGRDLWGRTPLETISGVHNCRARSVHIERDKLLILDRSVSKHFEQHIARLSIQSRTCLSHIL